MPLGQVNLIFLLYDTLATPPPPLAHPKLLRRTPPTHGKVPDQELARWFFDPAVGTFDLPCRFERLSVHAAALQTTFRARGRGGKKLVGVVRLPTTVTQPLVRLHPRKDGCETPFQMTRRVSTRLAFIDVGARVPLGPSLHLARHAHPLRRPTLGVQKLFEKRVRDRPLTLGVEARFAQKFVSFGQRPDELRGVRRPTRAARSRLWLLLRLLRLLIRLGCGGDLGLGGHLCFLFRFLLL